MQIKNDVYLEINANGRDRYPREEFWRIVKEYKEAKEEKGNIIFFHKVLPGPTDQSYGINVASLAKLPLEVTLRAKDILDKLETHNSYETDLLSKNNYTKPVIINNVDPKELEVLEAIRKLSTDDLKPIEALLKLSELKEKLGE